jgi:hypothetical protein
MCEALCSTPSTTKKERKKTKPGLLGNTTTTSRTGAGKE